MTQGEKLDRARYERMRAAGFTDEQIQADGFEIPNPQAGGGDAPRGSNIGGSAPHTETEQDKAFQRASRYANNYGMIDNALRVATLGAGDEIRAGVGALKDAVTGAGPLRDSYKGRLRAEEAGMDKFRAEHPVQSAVSTVAGIVPSLLSGGGAIKSVAQAAKVAGTSAGVMGFNEARGGLSDRAKEGAISAALGAGLGAATHVAAPTIAKVVRRFKKATPEQIVAERMAQGRVTLDDAAAAAAKAAKLDKPVALVDVGGKGVERLARDASLYPSQAADDLTGFLEGRMADQAGRAAGDVQKLGKITKVNTAQAIDELAAQRAELAKPLYDAVRDVAVPREALAAQFANPSVQKAYAIAQRVSANRAAAGEGVALPPLEQLDRVTVGVLDQIKRGLDDMLEQGVRSPLDAGGMGRTEAASLRQLKESLVAVADAATRQPDGSSLYKAARETFAGPSALMEQLHEGVTSFLKHSTSAEQVAKAFGAMQPAEREAFRAGALEAIAERAAKTTTGNDAVRWLDTPAMTKKLEVLLGSPEAATEWRTALQLERGFAKTRNAVVAGSRTAPMMVGGATLGGLLDDENRARGAILGLGAGYGGSKTAAATIMAKLLARGANRVTRKNAEQVLELLRSGAGGSEELAAVLAKLRETTVPSTAMSRGAARAVGALGGLAR